MSRGKHFQRKRHTKLFAVLVLLALLTAYPFYEAYHLRQEDITLEIADLPADLNGLRIVFISDIHAGPFFSARRVWNLVHRINALNADIILLGGDYAEDTDGAVRFFQEAPAFSARLLTAGVVGHHDRMERNATLNQLQSAMVAANVVPLVNNMINLPLGEAKLTIAGIDDYTLGSPDVSGVARRTKAEEFVIFLTHNPGALPEANAALNQDGLPRWYNLALCGYTHGGQVNFFGRPLIEEFRMTESRYLSGWIEENRVPILISNGVGTSYFPVRFAARPMIHLITLKRK
ncbi:MAG: metallophosphoesterase [Clostridia bacterium]|nr:metallophosphoesterase [Clostridia bacterium]